MRYFLIQLKKINDKILLFNSFLAEECRFPLINPYDSNTCSEKLREVWGGESWPNKDSYGVYFLFGLTAGSPGIVGLYIGKASTKYMGHRFWSHFKKERESGDFQKRLGDKVFHIYAVASVPVVTDIHRCIASALEEYLITGGLKQAILINRIGNIVDL